MEDPEKEPNLKNNGISIIKNTVKHKITEKQAYKEAAKRIVRDTGNIINIDNIKNDGNKFNN